MVHLQMNGFIADNMFQYTVGRLIAEELGYALRISHSKGKGGVNAQELVELLTHCKDAPLELAGEVYEAPVDYSAHESNPDFDDYYVDLDAMFANRSPRCIELRGHYQSYRMLRPYKTHIRSWFEMVPSGRGFDISPEDIVAHIRWGDLVVFDLAMSLSFYQQLLPTLEYRKLYVCGCGINDEVKAALAPFSPEYVIGTPAEDFRFMLGFNRIVQSNSGFAWWAGFLSQATEIYAPIMGVNTRTDHPKATATDIEVDDESRYHYIRDVPYLERDYTLADILGSRGQLRKKRIASSLREVVRRSIKRLLP